MNTGEQVTDFSTKEYYSLGKNKSLICVRVIKQINLFRKRKRNKRRKALRYDQYYKRQT